MRIHLIMWEFPSDFPKFCPETFHINLSNFTPVTPKEEIKIKRDNIFQLEFLPQVDALYNFAFHLTYNEDDANDLVQETFLKAYRFIDSYQQGTNAKAWLFKILKNGFINEYRKRSKQYWFLLPPQ